MLKDRFAKRMLSSGMDVDYSGKVFDEDYIDSDGDGYDNIFERALGLDSLGTDSPYHLPMQYIDPVDGLRKRISYLSDTKSTRCNRRGFQIYRGAKR